jgi:hypothetical protein
MGGLMVRYALGVLYRPACRTVAGLQARHFISMATPHLGCDPADGEAQVTTHPAACPPASHSVHPPAKPPVPGMCAAACGRVATLLHRFFVLGVVARSPAATCGGGCGVD